MKHSAKEFYLKEVFPLSYERNPDDIELWYETDGHAQQSVNIMIEFAKMHVEAALKAVEDKIIVRGYAGSIMNSYPLENIK
jgi:hypothetical protein